MKRLLGLVLLLAAPALAQTDMVGSPCNMTDGSCSSSSSSAPASCTTAGMVPVFLGSPLAMGCDTGLSTSGTGTALQVRIGGTDLFLTRGAAATLQLGAADAASPVAQTLQAQGSRGGTDTDTAGANLTIQSGAGTGSATGSSVTIKTPAAGSTGKVAQTQTTRLTIAEAGTDLAVGTGTAVARVGGVLNVNMTSRATTGTSEEVLATYTLPANTLNAAGKAIRVTAIFTTASNTNSKEARLKFGGIGGTQVAWQATASSGLAIQLTAIVVRTGASTQIAYGSSAGYSAPTQTLANNIDVVAIGLTSASAGDLTFKALLVEALN